MSVTTAVYFAVLAAANGCAAGFLMHASENNLLAACAWFAWCLVSGAMMGRWRSDVDHAQQEVES